MSFLDKLEKRFGRYAVPNVVMTLVIAQLIVYAMILTGHVGFDALPFVPKAFFAGEYWRIFSFIIAPPYVADSMFSGLFLAFYWYILWMMSSAIEAAWGTFRFNIFLLLGVVLSIGAAFLGQVVSPASTIALFPDFLYLSVFFAFAVLNPNIEFLIFFVMPVKVKWLAWIAGAFTAASIIFAPSLDHSIVALGPILNFLVFFRTAFAQSVQSRKRRASYAKESKVRANEAFHTCSTCGATDQTHPERHFRYKTVDGAAVCICEVCRGS